MITSTLNYNYAPKTVLFKGYQEDIRTGEALIKEINKMGFQSTSHAYRRYCDLKNSFEDAQDVLYLTKDLEEMEQAGDKVRKIIRIKQFFQRFYDKMQNRIMSARSYMTAVIDRRGKEEEYIQVTLDNIKNEKLANCGELATVGQYLLAEKGIEVDQVGFFIHSKETGLRRSGKGLSDHGFLVKNAGKDADFSDPKTWSNEAIIIDPWFGIVKRAHVALKQMKELMEFDPQKEELLFIRTNYEDKVRRHHENKKRMLEHYRR